MEHLVGALGVIIIFGAIIAFHEFGHFIAAKWSKMGVHEFSLGFGPALWQHEYRGTLYALRIIPLGGYVRIAGMEPGEDAYQADGFETKPFYAKFATLIAGVLMNFVLALIIFIIMGMAIGYPSNRTRIAEVTPNSPARVAGIRAGDLVTRVNDKQNPNSNEAFELIHNSKPPVHLVVERAGKMYPVTVTPAMLPGSDHPIIGVMLEPTYKTVPPGESITRGITSVYQNTKMMLYGLWMLFSGKISLGSGEVMGPIGIIHFTGQVAQKALSSKEAMADFLMLFALISMNVGVVNLLPFPALDGSRLLFLSIEKISRRSFNKEKEAMVHMVGMAILLTFIAFISVIDILHWIHPPKGLH